MKFKLSTTHFAYSKEEAEKLEKIGFKFEAFESREENKYYQHLLHRMDHNPEIEFKTFEELMEFVKTYGRIIITTDYDSDEGKNIELYDSYRE